MRVYSQRLQNIIVQSCVLCDALSLFFFFIDAQDENTHTSVNSSYYCYGDIIFEINIKCLTFTQVSKKE